MSGARASGDLFTKMNSVTTATMGARFGMVTKCGILFVLASLYHRNYYIAKVPTTVSSNNNNNSMEVGTIVSISGLQSAAGQGMNEKLGEIYPQPARTTADNPPESRPDTGSQGQDRSHQAGESTVGTHSSGCGSHVRNDRTRPP